MLNILIASFLFISTVYSLWSSSETLREVKSGHPDWLCIWDYAGIIDRAELEKLFGPPDENDRYSAAFEVLNTLRQNRPLDNFILGYSWLSVCIDYLNLLTCLLFASSFIIDLPFNVAPILHILVAYELFVLGWALTKTGQFWRNLE